MSNTVHMHQRDFCVLNVQGAQVENEEPQKRREKSNPRRLRRPGQFERSNQRPVDNVTPQTPICYIGFTFLITVITILFARQFITMYLTK